MISKALNESDRLSSCSKGGRRYLQGLAGLFNVFAFQAVDDEDTGGTPDEFLLRYNIGGIQISAEAFGKLQQEISLELHEITLPVLWGEEQVRLYSGLVPIGAASFHKILVREAYVPRIDARDFSLTEWTERKYYEVCTSEALNQLIHHSRGAAASTP